MNMQKELTEGDCLTICDCIINECKRNIDDTVKSNGLILFTPGETARELEVLSTRIKYYAHILAKVESLIVECKNKE